MKRLRDSAPERKITYMVTGEYGGPPRLLPNGKLTEGYRPHWHAIIFNYEPEDGKPIRTTEREDEVKRSEKIQRLWGKGDTEYGSVTIDSAGYVARYASKKLIHGNDQDHDYHPIHKTSSKRGIGRGWIEENYLHSFENGYVVGPNGMQLKIPRYYVDWAKKHHPSLWEYYVTEIRPRIMKDAEIKQQKEEREYLANRDSSMWAKTKPQIKLTILESKFKNLQEKLKL
ncbi:MAG: replication initiation protein [Malazfec virus 6]